MTVDTAATTTRVDTVDAFPVYRWLRPSVPQPAELVHLHELDRMPYSLYSELALIYSNPSDDNSATFMPTEQLIEGLERTLAHFSIYYGELVCTDALGSIAIQPSQRGIPVFLTQLDKPFHTFDPRWTHRSGADLLTMPILRATSGDPLLTVRLVRFAANSGVAVVTQMHHAIADIVGITLVLQHWAAQVCGTLPNPVVHQRDLLRGTPTGPVRTLPPMPDMPIRPRAALLMHISADQLAQLKRDVNASLPASRAVESVEWVSSIDALTALIVQTQLQADTQLHATDFAIYIPMEIRHRFPELVPANYFGNAVHLVQYTVDMERARSQPLGYIASIQRGAVSGANAASARRQLDAAATVRFAWDTMEDLLGKVRETSYCITDWTRLPIYSVDFGAGVPWRVRLPGNITGPTSRVFRGPDGAVEVFMSGPVEVVEKLRVDPLLRKYAVWID